MTDYGADVSTYPDLDPTFAWTPAPRMLSEAIARRLETPAGSLAHDPDYGLDLRAYLNDDLDERETFVLASLIQSQCEQEERVLSATVKLTQSMATQSLAITIELEPSDGPDFTLTIGIDQVGATLLRVDS